MVYMINLDKLYGFFLDQKRIFHAYNSIYINIILKTGYIRQFFYREGTR